MHRSACPCARVYIDKYALQGRLVYLWSTNTYLCMRARVSEGAHTLHTHTHARTLGGHARVCAALCVCV